MLNLFIILNFIAFSTIIFRFFKSIFKNQTKGKTLYVSLGLLVTEIIIQAILIILKHMSQSAIAIFILAKIMIIALPELFPSRLESVKKDKLETKENRLQQFTFSMIEYLISGLSINTQKRLKREAKAFFNHQDQLYQQDKKTKIAQQLNIPKSTLRPSAIKTI